MHIDGAQPAELADSGLRESLYRRMLLIRRFEERVYRLFLEGEIPGTLHQYQGQEAVAVGVCDALTDDDWITSTHRPHGHALAKGVSARAAMAELYGKATGCCNGKGGSMHLGDPAVGMLPAIAIVGGGNTVVTGLGTGDEAAPQPTRSPSASSARARPTRAPSTRGSTSPRSSSCRSCYVCENNLYGASTPYGRVSLRARRGRAGEGLRRARTDRRRDGRAGRAVPRPTTRWRRPGPAPGPRCSSARPTASPATAAATRAATGPARRRPRWAARDPLLVLGAMLAEDDDRTARGRGEGRARRRGRVRAQLAVPRPGDALEDVYA